MSTPEELFNAAAEADENGEMLATHVKVNAKGKKALAISLGLVLGDTPISGYREDSGQLQLLHRNDLKDAKPLPYPMTGAALVETVWGWLQNTKTAESGSVANGFCIETARSGWNSAVAIVSPYTIYYGK